MKIQIDDQVRNATDDEADKLNQLRADMAEEAARAAQIAADRAAAVASARAKLAKLGLTDDEIAAFLA